MKYYLISIITNSSDTETRNLTPYDDKETALRKFHEAFNSIGAGSKEIYAELIEKNEVSYDIIKRETWVQEAQAETEN